MVRPRAAVRPRCHQAHPHHSRLVAAMVRPRAAVRPHCHHHHPHHSRLVAAMVRPRAAVNHSRLVAAMVRPRAAVRPRCHQAHPHHSRLVAAMVRPRAAVNHSRLVAAMVRPREAVSSLLHPPRSVHDHRIVQGLDLSCRRRGSQMKRWTYPPTFQRARLPGWRRRNAFWVLCLPPRQLNWNGVLDTGLCVLNKFKGEEVIYSLPGLQRINTNQWLNSIE